LNDLSSTVFCGTLNLAQSNPMAKSSLHHSSIHCGIYRDEQVTSIRVGNGPRI